MKYLIFCFFLLNVIACTSRPVEPTRSSRHTIDTLFERQVSLMQPEIDSMCRIIAAKTYKEAIDSLMAERKLEMDSLVQ